MEPNEVKDERETAIPEQYSSVLYLPSWRCGNCKEPIPKRAKFCMECGRVMDWDHAIDLSGRR